MLHLPHPQRGGPGYPPARGAPRPGHDALAAGRLCGSGTPALPGQVVSGRDALDEAPWAFLDSSQELPQARSVSRTAVPGLAQGSLRLEGWSRFAGQSPSGHVPRVRALRFPGGAPPLAGGFLFSLSFRAPSSP